MPYLDQSGLTRLWDRMKAAFAPKSHTHKASEVTGVVTDTRINGESITADGVADVLVKGAYGGLTYGKDGLMVKYGNGLQTNQNGHLFVETASDANVTERANYKPLGCNRIDYAVKAAMCDGKGTAWTAAEQAAARERMGVDAAIDAKANIASPAFTGNPTAPTPSFGDSSKSLATTEFVAAAIAGAGAPTDYVVAQGTCDFWEWRMWASGVAECWGSTGETSVPVTTAWGSLFEGPAHSNGFPGNTGSSALAFSATVGGVKYSKLFCEAPSFCSCGFVPAGGAGISGVEVGGGLSATSTPTVYLLRPTAATVQGSYSYRAVGRWR